MRDPIVHTRSREQIARDTQAELDGWIEERTAHLVGQGLGPDEARRRAVEEFGDVDAAQRYARRQDAAGDRRVRALLWMEEMWSDLRIAARTLARTPTVTAVVLLTFALGIGATTSVFSVVHAMLLRPLPYGNEATLVYLPAVDNGVIRPGLGGARHSAFALAALRERTTSFSAIAAVSQYNAILTGHGDTEQLTGAEVSANTFEVLHVRAAIGRTFGANDESEDGGRVVVLLDDLWRRRFGADSSIVGRRIELSGTRLEVIGVMPPGFRVPTYDQPQYVTPYRLADFLGNPNTQYVRVLRLMARVKPDVSRAAAQADLDRAMRSLRTELPRVFGDIETRLVPMRTAIAGAARPRLLVLMGAAVFVLLIACANVAGILLSRAMARRHELAVRVALGAGRRRLIRQFLAEGVVLAAFGGGLGLLVAQFGIAVLRSIAAPSLPLGTTFTLEPRVLLFGVTAAIATAFASALVPALGATRVLGVAFRREAHRATQSRASRRMRLGLVAVQLAVSVVLLVGAGLLLRTVNRLAELDLGYSTEHALTFRAPFTRPKSNAEQDAFYESLYAHLRALPGVVSVSGGNMPLSGQGTVTGLEIEGRTLDAARPPDVRYAPASDDYFAALGIPIVRGRAFTPMDRDSLRWVGVVSVKLANELWPNGDPIGARVKVEARKPWVTIVGIVGDVRIGGADTAQPSIYTSQRQDHWPGGSTVVVRATGDLSSVAAGVRQVMTRLDASLPIVGLRTLDEFRRSTPAIAERRLQMQLMLVFALIALVVSAIGVYGVGAYATEARQREFGIRVALGASRQSVLWLALREGAHVALLGAALGVPLAWLLAVRIREMLYAVAPFDPLTVVAALGVLGAVVLAASIVPARRATLIDPSQTMRAD